MEVAKERVNTVKSILKAFTILEEINKNYEMSIGEISQTLNMDKATVHRLVSTMKEAGYLMQNPTSKRYSVSLKIFAMGNRVVERTGIKQIARPYIKRLAEETKETVNLGMRIDNDIVYVDKIESNSTIKVGIDIGTAIPNYCTGMGKAVIAFLSQEERSEMFENMEFKSFTKNTPITKESIEENLKKIRDVGFSTDDEEFVDGLISFGAPIFDFHGNPVAAVSVSYPKYRYEGKDKESEVPEKVVKTAKEISTKLGYKY